MIGDDDIQAAVIQPSDKPVVLMFTGAYKILALPDVTVFLVGDDLAYNPHPALVAELALDDLYEVGALNVRSDDAGEGLRSEAPPLPGSRI